MAKPEEKLFSVAQLDIDRDCDTYLYFWDCNMDEEREPEEILKLEFFEGQDEEPFESDLFILIEGDYTLELINQAVLSKDTIKICKIPATEYGIPETTPSILFKYKNILVASIELDIRFSSEVVELLRPYVELAKHVITINVRGIPDFRTPTFEQVRCDDTFLRGINSKLDYIQEIKPPNLVVGVCAGIASWRTFKRQSVTSYIVYVRQLMIDHESAAIILKLFRDLGLDCTNNYVPKRRQIDGIYL